MQIQSEFKLLFWNRNVQQTAYKYVSILSCVGIGL